MYAVCHFDLNNKRCIFAHAHGFAIFPTKKAAENFEVSVLRKELTDRYNRGIMAPVKTKWWQRKPKVKPLTTDELRSIQRMLETCHIAKIKRVTFE